jgi:sulfur carrier protein
MNESIGEVRVRLDGRDHVVPVGTTLAALVASLGHTPQAVGTAISGRFVPRDARTGHVLQPGDEVLLFQPIVGG